MLDADKAKERLQEILSEKEYTVYHENPKGFFASWWDQATDWIAEQLEKLFPSFEATSQAAGPLLVVIMIAIVLVLGVAAYFLIRNTNRKRKYREAPLQSMKELERSASMHLADALKREKEPDYSLAARHLFLALLLYFHENKWLEARIWKTNWEYYDELRKVNQSWADQFYHLARVFDEVTYGKRKIEQEEYEQFRQEAMKWLGHLEKIVNG